MAANQLRIVCTTKATHQSPAGYTHGHIVGVGIGDNSGWQRRYTVAEVRQMIASGWVFYTVSPSTRKIALVEPFTCCRIQTIRSTADVVSDNNLDNLPNCI